MFKNLNPTTAIALGVTLLAVFVAAAWGQHWAMDPTILAGIRTGAEAIAAILLASLGALFRKDENGNGLPDALERPEGDE